MKKLSFLVLILVFACGEANDPAKFYSAGNYEIVNEIKTSGDAQGVFVNDSLMLVAQKLSGVSVYDKTSLKLLKHVGGDAFRFSANGVSVQDTFVVVTCGTFGIQAIPFGQHFAKDTVEITSNDIIRLEFTDANGFPKPSIGEVEVRLHKQFFTFNNTTEKLPFAFIASGERGLIIRRFELANFTTEVVTEVNLSGNTTSVKTFGDSLVFTVNEETGLQIISTVYDSLNWIFNTQKLGSVSTEGDAEKLVLSPEAKYAFVANGKEGIAVVNCSNRNEPKLVKNIETGGTAKDIALEGDVLAVANSTEGLFIYDVTEKEEPELVSVFKFPSPYGYDYEVLGVTIHDGLIYASLNKGGIRIIRKKS
ncbi:hypothetical protein IT568_04920 [bacterium]|nr:hypothetical protein [bacterium]